MPTDKHVDYMAAWGLQTKRIQPLLPAVRQRVRFIQRKVVLRESLAIKRLGSLFMCGCEMFLIQNPILTSNRHVVHLVLVESSGKSEGIFPR